MRPVVQQEVVGRHQKCIFEATILLGLKKNCFLYVKQQFVSFSFDPIEIIIQY